MKSFNLLPEFEKDFKRLFKKYRTLRDDFEKFKKILVNYPTGVGTNFVIVNSGSAHRVVKARMACRTLCDRSLRVIYAYSETNESFDFIELYFKGDKEREDAERIKHFLDGVQ